MDEAQDLDQGIPAVEGPNPETKTEDLRAIVRGAIEEFFRFESAKTEPDYKAQLEAERARRAELEQRVNELTQESARSRAAAEEAERHASVREELQRLGVMKLDLAFRAVRDDINRGEDGRLRSRDGKELREYLSKFVAENPELLPGRVAGGSGAAGGQRSAEFSSSVDLNRIRPGMSAEERERARQEIARVASQTLRGI